MYSTSLDSFRTSLLACGAITLTGYKHIIVLLSVLYRDALCQSLELVELILKGITSILPNIDGPVVDGWLVLQCVLQHYNIHVHVHIHVALYLHVHV